MANTLITGGSGFVGGSIAASLASEDASVRYTYRTKPIEDYESSGLKINLLDSATFKKYASDLAQITQLVHAAAYVPSNKKPSRGLWEDFDNQITGPLTMLRNLLAHLPRLQKVVFISSCYVANDDPAIGLYGIGKHLVEEALRKTATLQDFSSIALRFPQIYGPGETHGMYINTFIEKALLSEDIRLDAKAAFEKDAVYIDDVVAAVEHALTLGGHHTVTLSSRKPYSAKEVADAVVGLTGQGRVVMADDEPLKPAAVRPLHFASDYEKLGFGLQYSLQRGIEQTINYYRGKK